MEYVAVHNLPDGTRNKLSKKAIEEGVTKKNGTANIADYLKKLILEDLKR